MTRNPQPIILDHPPTSTSCTTARFGKVPGASLRSAPWTIDAYSMTDISRVKELGADKARQEVNENLTFICDMYTAAWRMRICVINSCHNE